ncbi:MAG TPA: hypothetical protein VFY46_05875, partial [Acidimicrobiia bacterium]|nr:hypothetical protein [Acidimicrobiia bacterium]
MTVTNSDCFGELLRTGSGEDELFPIHLHQEAFEGNFDADLVQWPFTDFVVADDESETSIRYLDVRFD